MRDGQERHLTQREEEEGFLQASPKGECQLTAGEGAPVFPTGGGERVLRPTDRRVELAASGRRAEGQGPGVTVHTDAFSHMFAVLGPQEAHWDPSVA